MIILDTNVVSALMLREPVVQIERWLDAQVESHLWLTAISMMELRFGLLTMPAGKRRDVAVGALNRFLERLDYRIAIFDDAAAAIAADVAANRQKRGRPGDLRDTMIAGIALASHADSIATRNVRHFDDLSLDVINPWQ